MAEPNHKEIEEEAMRIAAKDAQLLEGKFNTYRLSKWRLYVLERDENTCQLCGSLQESGRLSAHHIYPKSLFPDEAYSLHNGIALCDHICHMHVVHAGTSMDKTHWQRFVSMLTQYVLAHKEFNEKHQHRI